MLSVVIPSRNEKYLTNTIDDILNKSTEEIEVIAILDGYWCDKIEDKRVHYIHYTESRGMRNAINMGVAIAKGEYIMKCDGHVMFDEGFDKKLREDHQDNWITIPRRYALDVSKWKIEERTDNKYPIDVMVLDDNLQGSPTRERKDNAVIPTESFQGSCWFMKKDYFNELGLMDEVRFGGFWQEAQEMAFKCEKNGGKVMRNTKTWYAHYHKTDGRGYSLNEDQKKVREEIRKLKHEK
jgi:glycosyltransferase involved in cell wall biosynthesis